MDISKLTETKTIRKGYKIHFIKTNRIEIITETTKPSSRLEGELKTNKNQNGYSVDFIHRYRENGFLKIYK